MIGHSVDEANDVELPLFVECSCGQCSRGRDRMLATRTPAEPKTGWRPEEPMVRGGVVGPRKVCAVWCHSAWWRPGGCAPCDVTVSPDAERLSSTGAVVGSCCGRARHGATTNTLVSTGKGRECTTRATRQCKRCVGVGLRIEWCGLCGGHAVCHCPSCAQRVWWDKSAVLRRQPTQPVQPAPPLAHRYPMRGMSRRTRQQCADVRPRGSISDTVTHALWESRCAPHQVRSTEPTHDRYG